MKTHQPLQFDYKYATKFFDLKIYILAKYIPLIFIAVIFISCSNKTEVLDVEPLSEYMPLQVGKSITYRLDSTVFTEGGTIIETHKYQVKHTVISQISDNGQTAFTVQRLINNENASGEWRNNGSYLITPSEDRIEVTNDNMRVTVLQAPLRQDFNWFGNSKLPFAPYNQLYNYSLIGYSVNQWNFTYANFGNETLQGQSYTNLWTVEHVNEELNMPPNESTEFATKELSVEKYAKGIGLVYKDLQLYEYQKGNASTAYTSYYLGFGITMWMIEHN